MAVIAGLGRAGLSVASYYIVLFGVRALLLSISFRIESYEFVSATTIIPVRSVAYTNTVVCLLKLQNMNFVSVQQLNVPCRHTGSSGCRHTGSSGCRHTGSSG